MTPPSTAAAAPLSELEAVCRAAVADAWTDWESDHDDYRLRARLAAAYKAARGDQPTPPPAPPCQECGHPLWAPPSIALGRCGRCQTEDVSA